MAEEKVTYKIEGDPGQNNTFVNIGHVENYNPNATTVNNTYYGSREGGSKGAKPGDKKLGNMTIRDMLEQDLVDTGNIQPLIMNYVSCIRPKVKDEMDKLYMSLWGRILEHEAFKIEIYDPGKQDCKFNRNLVANIMHYLDSKGFYKDKYNSSEMTRLVEGDSDNPVRAAFRTDPDKQFSDVVDAIIKELKDK